MEIWIPITLFAAFAQNLRSALQKHLKSVMNTTGATFARFGFGVPFACLFLLIIHSGLGYPFPKINAAFAGWAALGAVTQIGATFLLVHLFALRSFVVGTAYSRTEPAQAALFGLVFLGETVSPTVVLAIAVSIAGVILISVANAPGGLRGFLASLGSRAALTGLGSGALFGISAVAFRAASLALGGPNALMQAGFTLALVTALQTVLMLVPIVLRQPDELARIARAWKPAALVGLAGASASFGWFTAMTIQNAAVVRSLAQVEMLFTFASSVIVFRERVTRLEVLGCTAIVAAVLILLWAG